MSDNEDKVVCGITIVNSHKRTPKESVQLFNESLKAAAITSEKLIKGLSAMNSMLSKAVSASEKNF
jgi:hypothetical protein